jgi:hypothetical protein
MQLCWHASRIWNNSLAWPIFRRLVYIKRVRTHLSLDFCASNFHGDPEDKDLWWFFDGTVIIRKKWMAALWASRWFCQTDWASRVFWTVDYLQARFGLARDAIPIVYRPNLKRLSLIHQLMFDWNIFRVRAFESQKSNRRALFHLRLFRKRRSRKRRLKFGQTWHLEDSAK